MEKIGPLFVVLAQTLWQLHRTQEARQITRVALGAASSEKKREGLREETQREVLKIKMDPEPANQELQRTCFARR